MLILAAVAATLLSLVLLAQAESQAHSLSLRFCSSDHPGLDMHGEHWAETLRVSLTGSFSSTNTHPTVVVNGGQSTP